MSGRQQVAGTRNPRTGKQTRQSSAWLLLVWRRWCGSWAQKGRYGRDFL